jgi:lantibiotic modifying enzyme
LNRLFVNLKTFAAKDIVFSDKKFGFAHGVSGIAYALLRIFGLSQSHEYLDAALSLIATENGLLSKSNTGESKHDVDSEKSNASVSERHGLSWCRGLAGIGLARVHFLSLLGENKFQEDVHAACSTLQQVCVMNVDQPCCGEIGRLEFLHCCSNARSDADLAQLVQIHALSLVSRATQMGGYGFFPNLSRKAFVPGFFQGISGIGYHLLRFSNKRRIPSILSWESPVDHYSR